MKIANSLCFLGFSLLTATVWGQQVILPPMMQELSMTGEQYLVLNKAIVEFESKGLTVEGYMITLYKYGENILVLFDDTERTETQLGSTSRMRAYSVLLDGSGNVLRSNYVR